MTEDATPEFLPTILEAKKCLGCGHPIRARSTEAGHLAMNDHMERFHDLPDFRLLQDVFPDVFPIGEDGDDK